MAGIIVMPPSVHRSGKCYELLSDDLLTVTKNQLRIIDNVADTQG